MKLVCTQLSTNQCVLHLAFAVPVRILLCRTVPYRDFPGRASYRGGGGAKHGNGTLG